MSTAGSPLDVNESELTNSFQPPPEERSQANDHVTSFSIGGAGIRRITAAGTVVGSITRDPFIRGGAKALKMNAKRPSAPDALRHVPSRLRATSSPQKWGCRPALSLLAFSLKRELPVGDYR